MDSIDKDQRQAGASEDVQITPEMVEAGVRAYDAWEPEHVFSEVGAADYAKRNLVATILRVAIELEGRASQRR